MGQEYREGRVPLETELKQLQNGRVLDKGPTFGEDRGESSEHKVYSLLDVPGEIVYRV